MKQIGLHIHQCFVHTFVGLKRLNGLVRPEVFIAHEALSVGGAESLIHGFPPLLKGVADGHRNN
jgi:hypothetical protein